MKRLISVILLLGYVIFHLHAQPVEEPSKENLSPRNPEYGTILGIVATDWDLGDTHSKTGGKLGIYAKKQLTKSSDLCVELHLQQHENWRYIPHPYPNVIGMREEVSEILLRIPVSLQLIGTSQELMKRGTEGGIYLGSGIYLDTPLHCTKIEKRDYIINIQNYKQNVTGDFPILNMGVQFMLGIKYSGVRGEIRFSTELTSTKLPWIGLDRVRHYDGGLVLSFDLNQPDRKMTSEIQKH